jgi:hypothetical protein
LGVILYEMLCGQPPFSGTGTIDLLLKHISEAPRPPSEVHPELGIPKAIDYVVMQCLAKDPAARFRTMDALIAALRIAGGRVRTSSIHALNPLLANGNVPTAVCNIEVEKPELIAAVKGIDGSRPESEAPQKRSLLLPLAAGFLVAFLLAGGGFAIYRATHPTAMLPIMGRSTPQAPLAPRRPVGGPDVMKPGAIDLLVILDTNNLVAGNWSTTRIALKSSAWDWNEVELKDDGKLGDSVAGDGIYTFQLSQNLGPDKKLLSVGQLTSGDKVEFMFVVGRKEYKRGTVPVFEGVSAAVMSGGSFTEVPIFTPTQNPENHYGLILIP